MKPDLQRRIQRYGWDRAAPYYETSWQKQLWPAQEKLLSQADLEPGEEVLDISCGTGLVTLPIAEAVAPGTVTAIDISEGMIEEARSRADEHDFKNIVFQRMDAEKLDFPDKSFDAVICSLGLMYFPNPDQSLTEMVRVLRPGGRAMGLVWGERRKCGWAEIFPITDRRVKSDVCPLFFQLGTAENLRNSFETAGFSQISSTRFTYPLQYKDDNEACMAAFLGGAVALAYQKFDDQTKAEVHEEYLESIKAYRNSRGYSVPGEFVIVTGHKPVSDRN